MRIKLAGGVGEHGRNCFLVQGERLSFLVDCGKMAGAEQPNPYLEPEEIRSLSHVFLTHSHADHTGALPWLEEQGFDGIVAATPETLSQLKQMPQRTISLNEFSPPDGMTLKWGRSGHCTGSVWYHFHLEGRSLLFSGDYTEHSLAYVADPIRDLHADLAVLDSAYGPETRSAPEMRQGFLSEAAKSCGQGKPLVLPVPKYGRGLELAGLPEENPPAGQLANQHVDRTHAEVVRHLREGVGGAGLQHVLGVIGVRLHLPVLLREALVLAFEHLQLPPAFFQLLGLPGCQHQRLGIGLWDLVGGGNGFVEHPAVHLEHVAYLAGDEELHAGDG